MSAAVQAYLNEQRSLSDADLSQNWAEIENLYSKRMWHQLTLKLFSFVKHPEMQKEKRILAMYRNFVMDFEHRINPLSLVQIVIPAVNQMDDAAEAFAVVSKLREKVSKTSDEANVVCVATLGIIRVIQANFPAAKELLEEGQKLVDEKLEGITIAHSRFYEFSSRYYQKVGDHAHYYRESLHYLACCSNQDELNDEAKHERAFAMSLAALLAKDIYNFGELLAHPILRSLLPGFEWVRELLVAFNAGDLRTFEELAPRWRAQQDLAKADLALRRKLTMLCLMEMFFRRGAKQHTVSFEDIARETRVPINEVELLVMSALAAGLVKAQIDEVAQEVHVLWVQPRVLSLEQVDTLAGRFERWADLVKKTESALRQKGEPLFA